MEEMSDRDCGPEFLFENFHEGFAIFNRIYLLYRHWAIRPLCSNPQTPFGLLDRSYQYWDINQGQTQHTSDRKSSAAFLFMFASNNFPDVC